MVTERSQPASTADREIVVSRLFQAPRELVFKAFTDPNGITNWWGPNGFTTTTSEMDLRPGGVWRFVMHGPDGTDYPNRVVYNEVVAPERLVYRHDDDAGDGQVGVQFDVTVTFDDEGGKTRLTMRSLFETAAERARLVEEFGALEGANQTLERLGAYLKTLQES